MTVVVLTVRSRAQGYTGLPIGVTVSCRVRDTGFQTEAFQARPGGLHLSDNILKLQECGGFWGGLSASQGDPELAEGSGQAAEGVGLVSAC